MAMKPKAKNWVVGTLGNVGMALGAVVLALAIAEMTLRVSGMYEELATAALVPSKESVFKRPASIDQHRTHPDLQYKVLIRYDSSSVRNHSSRETSEKDGIIGVFGDSFTENIRVQDRFTFTSILDSLTTSEYSVVNFGVDAYGLEQSYLRYKENKDLNFRRVVYMMYGNDLSDLYENNIAYFDGERILFRVQQSPNLWRRTAGQLRLTYLILNGYYQAKALVEPAFGSARVALDSYWDRSADGARAAWREQRQRRRMEGIGHHMLRDFLGNSPSVRALEYGRLYREILSQWRREVEASGAKFTIVVHPEKGTTRLAEKMRLKDSFDVIRLADYLPEFEDIKFENDGHWNEVGNIMAAKNLAEHPSFAESLRPNLDLPAIERQLISDVQHFYAQYPRR